MQLLYSLIVFVQCLTIVWFLLLSLCLLLSLIILFAVICEELSTPVCDSEMWPMEVQREL